MNLAIKAYSVRYPTYLNPKTHKPNIREIRASVDLNDILKPISAEYDNNSLWSVYINIHHNIINGGFRRISNEVNNDTKRLSRPVSNIRQLIIINAKIWSMMESYLV